MAPAKTPLGQHIIAKIKENLKNMSKTEKDVYKSIVTSQSEGKLLSDIRAETKVPAAQLATILKALERKKIIKQLNTIEGQKKKLYMIMELEPSRSVTGGTWFNGTDFDEELIQDLINCVLDFLRSKGTSKLTAIKSNISSSGVSRQELSDDDVTILLRVMTCDGLIESIQSSSMSKDLLYRAIEKPEKINPVAYGLANHPCMNCPLFSVCSIENPDINSVLCPYFEEYLVSSGNLQ